ncbi:IclR family transcriptional regulator [Boseongicola aestuarii]|uniref:Acetate operon repressor n=1 Tax=Boseongicola aestuarii TaxID=1470561 RepID=A0A238IXJ0_9RHOB|nr:IclR family transcriptional regulator [Boseongicola aestuarii]SMX22470.1 Acetate operon repressor [Boseongicola aestuarii]
MPVDDVIADKTQIPTNLRLLLLIEAVVKKGEPVSPAALSETLDLPKATIHRLLTTAEAEGYLQRDVDGRSYGPGQRLRVLAANTMSSQRVRTERLLIMRRLAEDIGETCNLAAPERFGMIYLDRVETKWPLRIQLPVGTTVPFHCTASGKLYLSSLRSDKLERLLDGLELARFTDRTLTTPSDLMKELSDIRARGYSTDNEEFMDGMAAVAAPIRDSENRFLTAIAIHAPVQRLGISELLETLPIIRTAARKLEIIARS